MLEYQVKLGIPARQGLREEVVFGLEIVQQHSIAGAQCRGERAKGHISKSVLADVATNAAKKFLAFLVVWRPWHVLTVAIAACMTAEELTVAGATCIKVDVNEASATQSRNHCVVVTGYTASTSLADGADETWNHLLRGSSGIGELSDPFVEEYDLPVRIGGKLHLHPGEHLTRVERRRTSFVEQMALVLIRRLWADAGLEDMDGERLAVSVGTGLGGGDALLSAVDTMRALGHRKVSPMSVPMIMPNGPAALIGLETGAKAGVHTPVSACSSGSEAIAQGWRLIATGEADVVVAGGLEGPIDAVPIASFSAMRAMSTRNSEPELASRPFDRDRDGFVFGEAGALILLESEDHARARNARAHARVLGAGITSDAHHIVAPRRMARGPHERCGRPCVQQVSQPPTSPM